MSHNHIHNMGIMPGIIGSAHNHVQVPADVLTIRGPETPAFVIHVVIDEKEDFVPNHTGFMTVPEHVMCVRKQIWVAKIDKDSGLFFNREDITKGSERAGQLFATALYDLYQQYNVGSGGLILYSGHAPIGPKDNYIILNIDNKEFLKARPNESMWILDEPRTPFDYWAFKHANKHWLKIAK